MTEEELIALLGMGDITGAEQNVARQERLAQALRNAPFSTQRNMRSGGNIGRAAGGIAAAMSDYGADKSSKELTPMRRDALERLKEALLRKRNPSNVVVSAANLPEMPMGRPLDEEGY